MAIEETPVEEIYSLPINNIKILTFSVREETVFLHKNRKETNTQYYECLCALTVTVKEEWI